VPLHTGTIETPVGPLAFVVDDDGVVVASGFGTVDDQLGRLSADDQVAVVGDVECYPVAAAVRAYVEGDVQALGLVAVRQPGGAFQQRAWQQMRAIPAGQTRSYAELARAAGNPDAVRAAGTACAVNRVAPFVPCHRVVRSDGSLGGYYYGLDVKRWLLALERGRSAAASAQLTFDS
jgi:methylated-DNA-[protein]-cysteine S-methyltransferase